MKFNFKWPNWFQKPPAPTKPVDDYYERVRRIREFDKHSPKSGNDDENAINLRKSAKENDLRKLK